MIDYSTNTTDSVNNFNSAIQEVLNVAGKKFQYRGIEVHGEVHPIFRLLVPEID